MKEKNMNNLDNLRNEPPEYETKKQGVGAAKKNLILSIFVLDIFIFVLVAALFGWIDFIEQEYLIFGSVFFIVIQIFYIITQVIKLKKSRNSLN
jgi:uncharacterized membrane protein YkvI